MKTKQWIHAGAVSIALMTGTLTLAKDHGRGHEGREDRREDRDEKRGRVVYYYSGHDRDEVFAWYGGHRNRVPPGLAKRGGLPPGIARKFARGYRIPVEERVYIEPCPVEVVRRLPPPPPDHSHVVIDGHIVLLNNKSFQIADSFQIRIP